MTDEEWQLLQDIARARGLRLVHLSPNVRRLESHVTDQSFGAVTKEGALEEELSWLERATAGRPT